MTIEEAIKYLTYVYPNAEIKVLSKDAYNRLLRKAKAFDKICNQIEDIHYEVMKTKD